MKTITFNGDTTYTLVNLTSSVSSKLVKYLQKEGVAFKINKYENYVCRLTDILALFSKNNATSRKELVAQIDHYILPTLIGKDALKHFEFTHNAKVKNDMEVDVCKKTPEDMWIDAEIVATLFLNQKQTETNKKGVTETKKAFYDFTYYSNATKDKETKQTRANELMEGIMAILGELKDDCKFYVSINDAMDVRNASYVRNSAPVEEEAKPVVAEPVIEDAEVVDYMECEEPENDPEDNTDPAEQAQQCIVEDCQGNVSVVDVEEARKSAQNALLIILSKQNRKNVKKHKKVSTITELMQEFSTTQEIANRYSVDFDNIGINPQYLIKYNAIAQ